MRRAAAVRLNLTSIEKPSANLMDLTLASPLLAVVEEWLAAITDKPKPDGIAKITAKSYRQHFQLLARAGLETVGNLEPHILRAYAQARLVAGVLPHTNNHTIAAVGSLVRWLHAQGRFPLATLLETRRLYTDRPAGPPPHFLTPEQFLEFLRACERVHPLLARAALLAVETGARPSEWRTLRHEEMTLGHERPFVFVRPGKTRRSRTVPIRLATAQKWIDEGWLDRIGPILPGRERRDRHSPFVNETTLYLWLYKARKNLPYRVDWLTLRHTFASWHVQSGTSIAKVAGWCGHSVSMCWRHYAALAPGGDSDVERGFIALDRLENQR